MRERDEAGARLDEGGRDEGAERGGGCAEERERAGERAMKRVAGEGERDRDGVIAREQLGTRGKVALGRRQEGREIGVRAKRERAWVWCRHCGWGREDGWARGEEDDDVAGEFMATLRTRRRRSQGLCPSMNCLPRWESVSEQKIWEFVGASGKHHEVRRETKFGVPSSEKAK